MLLAIGIGVFAISTTVMIHGLGITWWLGRLRKERAAAAEGSITQWSMLSVLIKTAMVLVTLHVAEVLVWAAVYQYVREGLFVSFEEAVYFSFTTFTTLGFGDVVVDSQWRLLTGLEALNGVMLLGWSTAISFAVIQRILVQMGFD